MKPLNISIRKYLLFFQRNFYNAGRKTYLMTFKKTKNEGVIAEK